jgi:hypothetical protein
MELHDKEGIYLSILAAEVQETTDNTKSTATLTSISLLVLRRTNPRALLTQVNIVTSRQRCTKQILC